MKKIFIFVILALFTYNIDAQINPYYNMYNMGRGTKMYNDGMLHIMRGEDDEAFESFRNGINYTADNFTGLGICFELGFGTSVNTDKAWELYCEGARRGSNECKMAINRIRNQGFTSGTSASRNNFRNLIKIQQNALENVYGNGGYNGGGFNGGNNNGNNSRSSNSDQLTCPSCHGSGKCTGCAGRGEYRLNGTLSDCAICNGRGTCRGCYGKGWIR